MRTYLLGLLVMAGCTAEAAPNAPPPAATVALSAVNLADDCPDPPKPKAKPAPKRAVKAATTAPTTPAAPAVVAPSDSSSPGARARSSCDQTSMQLAIAAPAGAKTATVAVKKVELLDDKGAVLGTLKARNPMIFEADAYQPWNAKLAGGTTANVMWSLSSPAWDKVPGGRWQAHDKTFQLRVTITVGTASQQVEKTAIVPARLQPAVPT